MNVVLAGMGIGSEVLRQLSDVSELQGGESHVKSKRLCVCVFQPNCWLFQLAIKMRCTGMMFVVAENNEPSIQFYKRRGAEDLSQEEGWRLFKFSQNSLVKMATPAEEWLEVGGGPPAEEAAAPRPEGPTASAWAPVCFRSEDPQIQKRESCLALRKSSCKLVS